MGAGLSGEPQDKERGHKRREWNSYRDKHCLQIAGGWESCKLCLRKTRYPGTRATRLAAWRRDCKVDNTFNGHMLCREGSGFACSRCGRRGRLLRQVGCGSKHRGKVQTRSKTTSLQELWGAGPGRVAALQGPLVSQRGVPDLNPACRERRGGSRTWGPWFFRGACPCSATYTCSGRVRGF